MVNDSSAPIASQARCWVLVALLGLGVAGAVAIGVDGLALVAAALVSALVAAAFALGAARRRDPGAPATRTDPVTGCLDAAGFQERLDAELAVSMRRGEPAALVLAELTEVPAGAAGADMVRWGAERLAGCTRPGDVVARLAGGEFAILLPGTVKSDARAVADRARNDLIELGAAAVGLAGYPEDSASADAMWHHAREELRPGRAGAAAEAASVPLSWATAFARVQDRRMTARHDHSWVVAEHAAAIAVRLGWGEEDLEKLRLAAFLHDVGKVAVPERVLCKPGPLTPAEFGMMAEHPAVGARMVGRIEGLEAVSEWVLRSHERFDGSGYPDGLAGDAIPEGSRILLVADAFDAMTGPRPYQLPLSIDDALRELRRHAGTQFDPRVVEAFDAYLAEMRAPDGGDEFQTF
jgi:putative nucleotidyltransferase with HDIG domain